MVCAIRATFRFKSLIYLVDDQVHRPQHVRQHGVGFNLEVIWFEFNGHMPIAQVVGRADEVKGGAVLRACCDSQQGLRRRFNANQTAIIGDQHIATAHHMSALQKNRQHTTR
jgi:hypothetical protein